ncbi:hypothetical protein B0J12DRAFT_763748 [Macrophomina phaseolina]|uniref:Enoyl reductase (ER) domain-containing protein n=1 Tax=Macrophomina phaseolina TaxID=35725 RepID=A0ABQ8GQK9_9PEZI|nr:hypothetical protein B0J12DRAFT_763748 [Macrophomina phaseolina]
MASASSPPQPQPLLPPTFRAWQSTHPTSPFSASLSLHPALPTPSPSSLPPSHLLIRILSAAINPVDHKLASLGPFSRLAFYRSGPYAPGIDFCGRVVAASAASAAAAPFPPDTLVFGTLPPQPRPPFGTLGDYAIASAAHCVRVPAGVPVDAAAGVGIAGLSALQALEQGGTRAGDRVLVLGASGGVGTWAVQVAKRGLGAGLVVGTCSAGNEELVRGLGADEVVDYRRGDVVEEFVGRGWLFDVVVDCVGDPRARVYERAGAFLREGGVYVQVGAEVSVRGLRSVVERAVWPRILGGGERAWRFLMGTVEAEGLRRLGEWMSEGKVRAVVEETFEFEDVPKAFEKLEKGRARGKIVVHVGK